MWSQIFVYLCLFCIAISARGGHGGRSGGSHSYPHSTGYSGTSHGHTQTHSHSTGYSGYSNNYQKVSYPQSTGLSGNSGNYHKNTYTNSNSGNSVNNYHKTYTQNNHNYARTEVHHHYHYNPPQQIIYGSTYHPVYHGTPPTYIYEYRNSGSRFDTLLTGLALYNLGKMSNSHSYSHREYRSNPGEVCLLRVEKGYGNYEETRIDCKLMSSFIWESDTVNQQVPNKVTTVVQTVSSSGTRNADGTISDTTVSKTVTVTDALHQKGPSIQVMPGMSCRLIRKSWDIIMLHKEIDCALLQTYAGSMRYNRGSRLFSSTICFLFIFVHSLIPLNNLVL